MNKKSTSSISPTDEERITSEMEALSAIYLDNFKDITDEAELKCQIKLFPSNHKLALPVCYIKLQVTFIKGYPSVMPLIAIHKTYNLSKGELSSIEAIIRTVGKECSEQNIEMIHAICDNIQVIINKKALENEPIASLNTSGFSNSPRIDPDKPNRKYSINDNRPKPSDIIPEESYSNSYELQRKVLGKHDDLSMERIESKQLYNHSYSRFNSDFTVISKLGQGGGGSVFKVQNIWDKMHYAIKRIKITIPQRENLNSVLNTVRSEGYVLSRMQHPNIVRYYQTWVEEYNEEDYADEVSDEEGYEYEMPPERKDKGTPIMRRFSFETLSHNIINKEIPDKASDNKEDSYSDCLVMFEDDKPNSGENDKANDNLSYYNNNIWDDEDSTEQKPKEESKEKLSAANQKTNPKPKLNPSRLKTLYIQMEYCDGKTLREAIDNQSLSEEQKWKLIVQLLEAVNYIHSKKLIHRDIKPGNIFLDSHLSVKLGDFGLAKLIKAKSHLEEISKSECIKCNENDLMTYAIGTKYYCSPEQEKAKSYNYKTDMFSIGIILFEMFHSFGSYMERDLVLREIKDKNVFPTNFTQSSKENVIEIVEKLTKIDPNQRPKAKELLDGSLIPKFTNKEEVINSFNKLIEDNSDCSLQFLEQFFIHQIRECKERDHNIAYMSSYEHYHSVLLSNLRPGLSTNIIFYQMEKTLHKMKKVFHGSNAFYLRLSDLQGFNPYHLISVNHKMAKLKKSRVEIGNESLMLTQRGYIIEPLSNFAQELSVAINHMMKDKAIQDLLPCKVYSDTLTSPFKQGESKRSECYDLVYLNLWNDIANCGNILNDYDDKYVIDSLIVLFDVLDKLHFSNNIVIRINSTRIIEIILCKVLGTKEEMNQAKLDLLLKLSLLLNARDSLPQLKDLHKTARKKKIALPLSAAKELELSSWLEINGEIEALKHKFEKKDLKKEIEAISSLFQEKQFYWKGQPPSFKNKIKIDFSFIPSDFYAYSGIYLQVVYFNEYNSEQIPIAECGQMHNESLNVAVNHCFVLKFFMENIIRIQQAKMRGLEDYGHYKLDILVITTSETIDVLPILIEIERHITREKYKHEIIFRKQERTSFKEFFSHYRMKCLIIVKGKDKELSYEIKTKEMNKTIEHMDYSDLAYIINCFSRKKSK